MVENYVGANYVSDEVGGTSYPILFSGVGSGNVLGEGNYAGCNDNNPSGTTEIATVTTVLKKGSAGGDYFTSSTSFTDVDSSNLIQPITIPTGWKLSIVVSCSLYVSVAPTGGYVSLYDSVAGTDVVQSVIYPDSTASGIPLSLSWVISGDGSSHTIRLRWRLDNGSCVLNMRNGGSAVPTILLTLAPSN